ncbi:MAG TPA: hypothetical protein VMV29_03375, partial [Ktedonobacterales bacterium]|nr:hypothetical protein [Ktedonobacterales bacterium]
MGFRTSQTRCVVWLVTLRGLSAAQLAQCAALRREAARCWADLVTAHREGRERDEWIDVRELEKMSAGKYALHSQTIQALAQRLDANLQTAKELRERQTAMGQEPTYQYPYKTPPYQTIPWKDMAMRQQDGRLILSNGRGREPLVLTLPAAYQQADIRRAELAWRADH